MGAFLYTPNDGKDVDIAPLDIAPLDVASFRQDEREARVGFYGGGAVLPDGLALIELPRNGRTIDLIKWNVPERQFEPVGSIRP